MATNRLICALLLAGLAQAQSPPQQGKAEAGSKGEPSLTQALEAVKSLEERVSLLEQELLEVRQSKAEAAAAAQAGAEQAGGGAPRRPQIEEEEPFDASKMKATDEAEVEAAAKAVAVLLPASVKRLTGGGQPPAIQTQPAVNEVRRTETRGRTPAPQVTVQAGGPKATRRVEPVIPSSMRSTVSGDVNVSVKVYVGANGEVMGTVPVRQNDPTADQIGVLVADAVMRWRFEPVQQNGQPVATQTMVRFRFAN